MNVKLLTEHHLEFLSLKGGCTGWSESTRVKMPHCWKSHVAARILYSKFLQVTVAELVGLSLICFQQGFSHSEASSVKITAADK